jgi:ATP-dependent Clp protease ATP-binding subunit ClpC
VTASRSASLSARPPRRREHMFERYDDQARKALVWGQEAARRGGRTEIGTADILTGLLYEGFTSGQILVELGTSFDDVAGAIARVVPPGPGSRPTHLPFDRNARRVIELTQKEAKRLRDDAIGTEHVLLGLLREGKSFGPRILNALGITYDGVRDAVIRRRDAPAPM